MYHSFLIHSTVYGHLDCFHVLAVVSGADMNIGEPMLLLSHVSRVRLCATP